MLFAKDSVAVPIHERLVAICFEGEVVGSFLQEFHLFVRERQGLVQVVFSKLQSGKSAITIMDVVDGVFEVITIGIVHQTCIDR